MPSPSVSLPEAAMEVALDAAAAAGKILVEMLNTATVREKGPKDLVTDADLAAQAAIQKRIESAFPLHRFVGEESVQLADSSLTTDSPWCWVVDPLDGTANYAHRLSNFAVSIALMHNDQMMLGVVFDPMANELFTAAYGSGATLNGVPIRPSTCQQLDSAMVAVSFPPAIKRTSPEISQFVEVLVRSQSVRRLGSAALNLCYVAMGRLDAYWGNSLKLWDIAGAALIAQEAGAVLRKHNGDVFVPHEGELLATATLPLNLEMQTCLQQN